MKALSIPLALVSFFSILSLSTFADSKEVLSSQDLDFAIEQITNSGVFVNQESKCAIHITQSVRWGKTSVAFAVSDSGRNINTDYLNTVSSLSLSVKDIEEQVLANQTFGYSLKKGNRTDRATGRLSKQANVISLELSVASEACVGFCSTHAASCKVKLGSSVD